MKMMWPGIPRSFQTMRMSKTATSGLRRTKINQVIENSQSKGHAGLCQAHEGFPRRFHMEL
jgi:hypothetical protein